MERVAYIRFLIVVVIVVAVVVLSCSNKAAEPLAEPLENHVYLPERDTVLAGTHFALPVYFANEAPLSGISVPLVFSSPDVECESLSFAGSRVADWLFNASYYDNETREIRLGAVSAAGGLPAGRGLLATIFMWVHGNATATAMVVDTAWLYPNLDLRYADTSIVGNTFVPRFTPALIHIETQL